MVDVGQPLLENFLLLAVTFLIEVLQNLKAMSPCSSRQWEALILVMFPTKMQGILQLGGLVSVFLLLVAKVWRDFCLSEKLFIIKYFENLFNYLRDNLVIWICSLYTIRDYILQNSRNFCRPLHLYHVYQWERWQLRCNPHHLSLSSGTSPRRLMECHG
jgi:hypothetical protein